jgi:hypothetical protein
VENVEEITFSCHFLRKGEAHQFTLMLDPMHHYAQIRDTRSGHEFKGHIEQVRRFTTVHLKTTISEGEDGSQTSLRSCSFLICAHLNNLKNAEILTGIMYIIAPNDELFANLVILKRQNSHKKTSMSDSDVAAEHHGANNDAAVAIEYFLRNSELPMPNLTAFSIGEIKEYLQKNDAYWRAKHTLQKNLSGQYQMFYIYEPEGRPVVAARPVTIYSNGKAEKKSLDYADILEFTIVPLNNQSVLMSCQPDRGMGSSFFIGQLNGPHDYSIIYGKMVGLSQSKKTITNKVFLKRVENNAILKPENFELEAPLIRELASEQIEFRRIVDGI